MKGYPKAAVDSVDCMTSLYFFERNIDEEKQVQVFTSALSRFPLEDIAMLPGIRNLVMEYHSRNDNQTESNEASLRHNQNL